MNQFEKIDFLINEYKKGNYRTASFCEQFEYIFFREKDGSIPDELWVKIRGFAEIFGRFSPYEEDVKTGVLFPESRIQSEFEELLKKWNDREFR